MVWHQSHLHNAVHKHVAFTTLAVWSTVMLAGLVATTSALACQICLDPSRASLVQALELRSDAVLAKREIAGGITHIVVDTVIGTLEPGSRIEASSLRSAPVPVRESTGVLLLRDTPDSDWRHVAVIQRHHIELLREFAAMTPTAHMGFADWLQRTRYFIGLLDHEDPLLAETAYLEIARAPYSAIRTLGSHIPPGQLAAWLDTPTNYREPLYLLLLGVAGDPRAAATLEMWRRAALAQHNPEPVAAVVTGLLEIHGEEWLQQVFDEYLSADAPVSLPEIQAVLLALSVQGGADSHITQSRIIDIYARFIDQRPALAGFVTPDLIEWGNWTLTECLLGTLETDTPSHPASRFLINRYLAQARDKYSTDSSTRRPKGCVQLLQEHE
jgi:hypothetical protein